MVTGNPMTAARAEAAAALVDLGVTVYDAPPGAAPGTYVVLVAGQVDSRGHVDVEVWCSSPVSPGCVDRVEQLAWDARQAIAAAGMGWRTISAPQVDSDRLIRTITITTRP